MTTTSIRLATTWLTAWAKKLLTTRIVVGNGSDVPAGVIGGAVITAVRRSAGLSRHGLARRLGVARAAVRGWDMGAIPLYWVPYTTLAHLAEVLSHEAFPSEVILSELLLAAQCDHLIASLLLGDEDFADVPPIDEHTTDGAAGRQLFRWAISGPAPDLYQHVASAGPFLASSTLERLASIAQDLAAIAAEPKVAAYGRALAKLTKEGCGSSESFRLR